MIYFIPEIKVILLFKIYIKYIKEVNIIKIDYTISANKYKIKIINIKRHCIIKLINNNINSH